MIETGRSAKTSCNLTDCFLCRNSNPAWKELIAVKKQTLFFRKGEKIFKEGEQVTGIYFMYSGSVKVHKKWMEQKELIIRFAKRGDVLGHRGLGMNDVYPVTATALEDVKTCFISNEFFETSLQANPSLTYRFMQFYSDELQKAEMRMRNLALMEVKGRIAEAILEIFNVFGTDKKKYIAVPVSRQDISAYAGTTYETVFKFLRTLIAEKTISVAGKSIRINNMEKLSAMVKNAG